MDNCNLSTSCPGQDVDKLQNFMGKVGNIIDINNNIINMDNIVFAHTHRSRRAWVVVVVDVGGGCYIKGNVRMHHYVQPP